MRIRLDKIPIENIKNVGKKKSRYLKNLRINTVEDLLLHFPRKYEDRSNLKKISQLVCSEEETIMGKVQNINTMNPRPKLFILKCNLTDKTGEITAVWFNQLFLKKHIKLGTELIITGKISKGYWGKEIVVKEFEIVDSKKELLNSGRIVPVYPITDKINQKFLRTLIWYCINKYIDQVNDILPLYFRKNRKLFSIKEAIKNIHFPSDFENLKESRKTLAYQELFFLQFSLSLIKKNFKKSKGISHKKNNKVIKDFINNLNFNLTNAQNKVWKEINRDMENYYPMTRLVQGDVGSGKTIIAIIALIKCFSGGYQGALMVPTEILAEQHFLEFKKYVIPLGINVELLVGSMKKNKKLEILDNVKNNKIDILIGTHSLIQDSVIFDNLGLIVIDEQHRFGVGQRSLLKKKGYNPDMLVMTATPIPRTLALILYGDLDISVIDELPPGRKEIITRYVSEKNRQKAYQFIKKELIKGRQCYIICPLIEENEKIDLEAAQTLTEKLKREVFPDFTVEILHGRLNVNLKEEIMSNFRDGKIAILVSTTVIEVGVNVKNANIILIEDSERFGLAQLHQLRGRIGRGNYKSYCILMGKPKTYESKKRLNIMIKTSDGFIIAEEDLKIRGPGEFFGLKQHGFPELRVADIFKDKKLLKYAREDVLKILKEDSIISLKEEEIIKNFILENYSISSI